MIEIKYVKVNLGRLPSFNNELVSVPSTAHMIRSIYYQAPHVENKFPLLISDTRLKECLEANLFLDYRYKGKFIPPQKGGQKNLLGGVQVKTIKSIANSLKAFLTWFESEKLSFDSLYAVSITDEAKQWLPAYRYRKHLIIKVNNRELDLDTANLYIAHVRQFYEWAYQTKRMEKLPFKYKNKIVRKNKTNSEFDLLFSSPFQSRGIEVTTSDLKIPRKHKQKRFNTELTPFNKDEINLLFSTKYIKGGARRLWCELGLFCGLRAVDIVELEDTDIVDISLCNTDVFTVSLTGKQNKSRKIHVARSLMGRLWDYKVSAVRLSRIAKWEIRFGTEPTKKLFINRSGNKLNTGSITNIPSKVNAELSDSPLKLERSFHDLRATFATSLAMQMLKQNLPLGFLQYKLMQLMGHNQFSTTEKYINMARSTSFNKQMSCWVEGIFKGIEDEIKKERKKEKEGGFR